MRRLLYIILIVLLISICGCFSSYKDEVQENHKITSIIDEQNNSIREEELDNISDENQNEIQEVFQIDVDETIIMNSIEKLCQSPRRWGSQEEKNALDFLNLQLNEYGYETNIQKFPVFMEENNYYLRGVRFENMFNFNPDNLEPLGYGHNLIATNKTYENIKKH